MQPQTKQWSLLRSMRHSRRYDFQGHPRSGSRYVGLNFKNDDFQNLSPVPFFNHIKKIPMVSDIRPKYLKSLGPDFWISSYLSSHVTSKFAKKLTSSDLNETWYDVRGRWDIHDMTFKVIRGQGQGKSPFGTIFYIVLVFLFIYFCQLVSLMFTNLIRGKISYFTGFWN